MRGRLLSYVTVLAVMQLASPPVVGADDFPAAAGRARAELVADLEELTQWCRSKRLYGKRDEAYALILRVDPEHVGARHALEYERAEDGSWVQSPRFKRGTNWSRSELPNYDHRLAGILDHFARALVAAAEGAATAADLAKAEAALTTALELLPGDARLLDGLRVTLMRHAEILRPAGAYEARLAVRAALLDRFGEDATVRALLGDVLWEGSWMPADVARARERNPGIELAATAALEASATVEVGALGSEEEAVAVPWEAGFETPHARVLGVAQTAGLRNLAVHSEAAGPFFEAVFGRAPVRPQPLTIYVFENRDHGEQFLHKVPGLTSAYLEHVLSANLKGFSLGTDRYVINGVNTADTQLDMGVLTTFDTLLQGTFGEGEGGEMRGWIYEGVSRYLTFRLAGLRLSVTAGGRYAQPTTGGARGVGGALAQAQALYEAGKAPPLRLLLGKHLDGFTAADATCAYAFAAYLVEARPDDAAALLELLIRETALETAFAKGLKETLPDTAFRFRIWLAEVTRTP